MKNFRLDAFSHLVIFRMNDRVLIVKLMTVIHNFQRIVIVYFGLQICFCFGKNYFVVFWCELIIRVDSIIK